MATLLMTAQHVRAIDNNEIVRTTIQDRYTEYPVVDLNTDPYRARYKSHELNRRRFKLVDKYYDAIAFKTPDKPGDLIFSFVPVEQEVVWQIIPYEGTMPGFDDFTKQRLRRTLKGIGYSGQQAIFQRLPAGLLRPNTTYLIWFSFRHTNPVKIPISLNMFSDNQITYKDIHPEVFTSMTETLSKQQTATLKNMIQLRADDFKSITAASIPDQTTYQVLSLNDDPINAGHGYYDARAFEIPQAGGEIVLSFVPPNNLADWYIIPHEGDGKVITNKKHISRGLIAPITEFQAQTNAVSYQRITGIRFEGGQKFLLAFRFKEPEPTNVPVSIAVLAQPGIPFGQTFPDTWNKTAYELSWDLLQVAGWKLQRGLNLDDRVDLYMQLMAPQTWLRARNNEFEMRELRARYIQKMRREIDRLDVNSNVVVQAEYKFGKYDFAKQCFPLEPSSSWISQSSGTMTITMYRKHQGVSLTRRQLTARIMSKLDCLTMPQEVAKKFLGMRTSSQGIVDRSVYVNVILKIIGLDGKEDRKLRGQILSVQIFADPDRKILIQQS